MSFWTVLLIVTIVNAFVIYWALKFLSWVGDIPPFTIRSLIKNRGRIYWPETEPDNVDKNE